LGDHVSGAPGFAFVKIGEFSHANRAVLEQLTARFPHLEPCVIDLNDLEIIRRWDVPGLVLSVMNEFGAAACMSVDRLRRHIYKTTYMMRRTRAALLRHLSGRPFVFTFQTQSLFDASVPGIPHFIYTDHTHLENLRYPLPEANAPLSRRWASLERGIYQNARSIFTMSDNIARSLVEEYGCSPQKVACVYAGSNVSAKLAQDIDNRRFARKNILFVGVDWERKGGPDLLEAFRAVRLVHPDARLTIVGCSPPISEPGVHVAGRVPLEDVPRFYRETSVFCLPTLNEPFGLVFLEAGMYGLPVVATPIGAIPEIVRDGETGYLVAPRSPRELAARLSDLIGAPELCERVGIRARQWISARYSWENTGQRIAANILKATERVAPTITPVAPQAASEPIRLVAI
jgi:glycosyltransferase involved in cell wall biosynthesis